MSRPVFIKLGGSVVTDKAKEATFRRAVAKRLLAEVKKSGLPVVLFHGAGSFGHPPAKRAGIGRAAVTAETRHGVAETAAAVAMLHAHMLQAAADAGLDPVPVPVALDRDGAGLGPLPTDLIASLLDEGYTPVLHGQLARDPELHWSVVSADELMLALAEDLEPRLAVFVTDVDGVLDASGTLIPEVASPQGIGGADGVRGVMDVTQGMAGKVRMALGIAATCPTLILNGTVRGRLLDALKGKPVPSTRPLP